MRLWTPFNMSPAPSPYFTHSTGEKKVWKVLTPGTHLLHVLRHDVGDVDGRRGDLHLAWQREV